QKYDFIHKINMYHFFSQAEDGIRGRNVTGVQTCALPILFAAAGQKVPEVKFIFELNPDHVLVKRAADTEDEAKFSEWVELLLDQIGRASCREREEDRNEGVR